MMKHSFVFIGLSVTVDEDINYECFGAASILLIKSMPVLAAVVGWIFLNDCELCTTQLV